jgi:hypothetical protein
MVKIESSTKIKIAKINTAIDKLKDKIKDLKFEIVSLKTKYTCSVCGSYKILSQRPIEGKYYCKLHKPLVCCECGSTKRVCQFKDTGKLYCNKHYTQIRTHGKVHEAKVSRPIKELNVIELKHDHAEIILIGKSINEIKEIGRAIIDLDKVNLVKKFRWVIASGGYVSTKYWDKNKAHADSQNRFTSMLLHRLILGDKVDDTKWVKHKNKNRLDNRISNLRIIDKPAGYK